MKSVSLSFIASLSASLSICAAVQSSPSIEVDSVTQDQLSRLVTVKYTLSNEPAVVTLGVETNRGDGVWVSIGDANIQYVSGDVNRMVDVGSRTIAWRPDKSWPNHSISDGSLRVGVVAWATNAPPDYMVVDLQNSGIVRYYPSEAALPGGCGASHADYKTNLLLLRKVPAGGVEWNMGSRENLRGNESIHRVFLSDDYYIGVYEITRRQYALITGKAPSSSPVFPGDVADQCPVDSVKWVDIRSSESIWPANGHSVGPNSAMGLLRTFVGKGYEFDLPTEAQWEYACRAGNGYDYNVGGDTWSDMERAGWCKENSGCDASSKYYAHAVGGKEKNAWGLYDMHGNIAEWCLDYYGGGDYPSREVLTVDPKGAESGTYRVRRGGDKGRPYGYCRSSQRFEDGPNAGSELNGFRIVCTAVAR